MLEINNVILKCPHCGNRAEVFTNDKFGIDLQADHPCYSVCCVNCSCGSGWYADKERAIEAWNRRI